MRKYVFWKPYRLMFWGTFNTDEEAKNKASQLVTTFFARWDTMKNEVSDDIKRLVDGSKSGGPVELKKYDPRP